MLEVGLNTETETDSKSETETPEEDSAGSSRAANTDPRSSSEPPFLNALQVANAIDHVKIEWQGLPMTDTERALWEEKLGKLRVGEFGDALDFAAIASNGHRPDPIRVLAEAVKRRPTTPAVPDFPPKVEEPKTVGSQSAAEACFALHGHRMPSRRKTVTHPGIRGGEPVSYARFSAEGSTVYVYLARDGLECCACSLRPSESVDRIQFGTTAEMIEHLDEHRRQGGTVPEPTYEQLRADRLENDAYLVRPMEEPSDQEPKVNA